MKRLFVTVKATPCYLLMSIFWFNLISLRCIVNVYKPAGSLFSKAMVLCTAPLIVPRCCCHTNCPRSLCNVSVVGVAVAGNRICTVKFPLLGFGTTCTLTVPALLLPTLALSGDIAKAAVVVKSGPATQSDVSAAQELLNCHW